MDRSDAADEAVPVSGAPGPAPRPDLAARASAAVVAYRDGRTGPLEALVREATPLLWHVARSQGVERDDAEDVVQGVWLAFVRNAGAIRDPAAALGWLVVSTRRSAWQVVHRRRDEAHRTQTLPDPLEGQGELASVEPPVDTGLLTDERDRALWAAFAELPERCRQILRAVAAADRPNYRAIAEATGMKVTAVGITRGRCLARLRTLLGADEGWVRA